MPTMLLQLAITLFTADNYPQIMYASFSCAEFSCGPITGTLFFISFVLLGHIILMTVFSA